MHLLYLYLTTLGGLLSAECSSYYPTPFMRAAEIMKFVLADDLNWWHVLGNNVKLAYDAPMDKYVKLMAASMGFSQEQQFLNPYKVAKYLANSSGVTGTQLHFGMEILGTALSCQFMKNMQLYTYFIGVLASRNNTEYGSVQICVSKLQFALAKYIDKLAAFGQPFDEFLIYNTKINDAYKTIDHSPERTNLEIKSKYVDMLIDISKLAGDKLAETCEVGPKEVYVSTMKLAKFTEDLMVPSSRKNVQNEQITALIREVDHYDYLKISSMDNDFWINLLNIEEYEEKDTDNVVRT